MKLKIFSLPALILAGAAMAQPPAPPAPAPPAPPPIPAPPAPPPAEEADFDVRDLRAASVPLVAAPLDLEQPSDPIWVRGDRPAQNRIATLSLRPIEGAVIEQDIGQGPDRPVVLSLAVTGAPSSLLLGSSLRQFGGDRFFCGFGVSGRFDGRVMCLVDSDNDGRFEAGAIGMGETGPDPRQLSMIGKVEPLPALIPYRAARPEELPETRVAYLNCARDHDRPRYSLTVAPEGPEMTLDELLAATPEAMRRDPALARRIIDEVDRRRPSVQLCQVAERAEPGDAHYPASLPSGAVVARLGELTILVGPRDAGANVQLLGLRHPERLYRITGRDVSLLSETTTPRQNQLAIAQRFNRPVLMLAADPEVREGIASVDDRIMIAPIRHGYMGVLTQDTVIRTLLSRRSLAAGTVVYGIPMSSSTIMTRGGVPIGGFGGLFPERQGADSVRLTWCVPVEDDGEWTATCLPTQAGGRYTILRGQSPAFEVRGMTYDAGTSTNDGDVPVVEREGDFGAILSYVFTIRSASPAELVIGQDTMLGDRRVYRRDIRVPRQAGQPIVLSFADGALTLTETADGNFEVRRTDPFRIGADVATVVAGAQKAD